MPTANLKYTAQTHQEILLQQIRILFPGEKTYVNARKQVDIKHPITGAYLEIDVYIPSFNICFEFQDEYHYNTTWYTNNSQQIIHEQDYIKKEIVQSKGLSLVEVPCWWDGSILSLSKTIHFQRPDINLLTVDYPIALNPPSLFFQSTEIPDVGELMLASFPVAQDFNFSIGKDEWWMGEKYDGIRCCWHPEEKNMYSRTGRDIYLPNSIIQNLPSSGLIDGECWFGRGTYQFSSLMVSGDDKRNEWNKWHQFRLMSFDNPSIHLAQAPFEERYQLLLASISACFIAILAPRISCKGTVHLHFSLQSIIDNKGEGVVLRAPNSLYERGRSNALLKLKTTFGDREAIVIGIDANNSVKLSLHDGNTFSVPSSNVICTIPQKGDIVSFAFDNNTRRDVPVSPKIYRIRTDLSWEDVIKNEAKEKQLSKATTQLSEFWNNKDMRLYLENFAKKRGMDPLQASTWHKLSSKDIINLKGGRKILRKFKGYFKGVRRLFPEIKFSDTFSHVYWVKIENRRRFFENFASQNGFDHQNPANWYRQPPDKIMEFEGAGGVISYHKYSISRALVELFPNISFDRSMFGKTVDRTSPDKLTLTSWHNKDYRRSFFEEYARSHSFDPLIARNWYKHPIPTILSAEGAKNVVYYHHNSIVQALIDLFPDIGIEEDKFMSHSWDTIEKRRKFFINFAAHTGFDPLVTENWNSQQKLLECEELPFIVSYHSGSLAKALKDLFPCLDPLSIRVERMPNRWNVKENRRNFFEEYANDNGFDPLVGRSWATQSLKKILQKKGAKHVLQYHQNSLRSALTSLFPDIKLEEPSHGLWHESNRRSFFEKYAKENGFDPLHAERWYSESRSKIMSFKGARGVMFYHNQSVKQALIDLYPSLGLEKEKFWA